MSGTLAEVWKRLGQAPPSGDQLTARPAFPDIIRGLLCALDAQGQRHLLIALTEGQDNFRDAQSRGLRVETRDLHVRGRQSGRYLDIECRDTAGYPILDLIGNDLAQELSRGGRQPAEITKSVLAKWRRFWGRVPRSLLSREEQLGMFGELWFLHVWLTPVVGPAEAVQRWRGPFGSRHDYEWPERSVEVKVTTSTRGRIHWIHGIDQLLPPEGGELCVFGMRLREEAGATNSLPALVARIREGLRADADTMSRYESALLQAGYSPAHEEEYEKMHLRLVEERLYEVRDDFPCLTPQSLGVAVPSGVERVDYEINLNTFDHLCVARNPAEVGQHLQ
jgi:hypothetical protein